MNIETIFACVAVAVLLGFAFVIGMTLGKVVLSALYGRED
jgi:hypothetical protein